MTEGVAGLRFIRFEDLTVGETCTEAVDFSPERVETFGQLIQDSAPVHSDLHVARLMGYPGPIVHGFHVASRFSRLLGMCLPGPNCVIQSVKIDFAAPVYVGQRVHYTVRITKLVPAMKTVVLELKAADEAGNVLVRGTGQCGMRGPA